MITTTGTSFRPNLERAKSTLGIAVIYGPGCGGRQREAQSPPSWIVTRNVAEFAKSTRCIDHVNSILEEYEDGELDFLLTYGVEQQSVQEELKKAETDTKEVNDMALWSQALERRSQLQTSRLSAS